MKAGKKVTVLPASRGMGEAPVRCLLFVLIGPGLRGSSGVAV